MKTALPSAIAPTGEATAAAAATSADRHVVRLTVIGFAVYCLFMLALKWFGFSAAIFDHAKEIYHAQELRWVYDGANPSLYTWILYGLQQLFGAHLVTVIFLNCLLLFFIFLASFLLARRVLGSPVLAALAAWSLMLLGQYHKLIYTMSHSLLAAIFAPLFLWLFLRALSERRLGDYAAAGLMLGLGLLSKFLVLAAAAAAVIAALGIRRTRGGVLNPKFAVTVAVAAVLFLPFVIASLDQWSRLVVIFHRRVGEEHATNFLSGIDHGFLSFSASLGEYAVGLVLPAAAAIAWAALMRERSWRGIGFRSIALRADAEQVARPDELRLIAYMALAGLGMLMASVLVGKVSRIKPHYLHIFFFALPVLAVALVAARRSGARALRVYAVLLCLVGFGILAVRVVNTTPVCLNRCYELVPFDRLADKLAAAGFRRGTIFAYGVSLAGNLVLHFPEARIDVAVDPFAPAPPPAGRRGQCLIVWERSGKLVDALPTELIRAAGITPSRARSAMRSVTIDWRWYGLPVLDWAKGWRPRKTTWGYVLLPEGTKTCR